MAGGEIMETKAVFICTIYILAASLLQFIFYGDDIVGVEEPQPSNIDIPIISQILAFFGWAWYVVNIFINMFTFNIPELPLIIRIFFIVPFWVCWGYLLLPLITRLARAIGSLLPFT